MSTSFKELPGSPLETFGPEGMTAQRRLLVAWEERHAMVAELLGGDYQFAGLARAPYPDRPWVVVAEVRIEPWPQTPDAGGPQTDVTVDRNAYTGKYALLTVDYEVLDATAGRADLPAPRPGTFLTYRMELGGEYVALAGQGMHWAAVPQAPVPPDAARGVRVPIVEHQLTWHRVASPPWGAIRHCAGTINGSQFLGAPAETLLFDGAVARKQLLGVNNIQQPLYGWRLSYIFREKAIKAGGNVFGWNHRYRSLPVNDTGWDRLVDANGEGLYRLRDFATLFAEA